MSPEPPTHRTPHPRPALAVAVAIFLVALVPVPGGGTAVEPELVALLAGLAVLFEVVGARFARRFQLTGSESCYLLAMVVAGTGAGVLISIAVCVVGWLVERYRFRAFVINLAGYAAPVAAAGALFHALVPDVAAGGLDFVGALILAVVLASVGNLVIVLPLMALLDGASMRATVRTARTFVPAFSFQAAFIISTVASYVEYGSTALAFVVIVNVAFAYMYRLVITARDRARAHANLSWGLLSGLIRTLDARDTRAARHCAAVSKFSRDIAAACGMSRSDQDLAHTAGLLHDIGRFALSDRVMDRGTQLLPDDWKAIRRHPELGAELLKDIGVYGPVAEIIRAHHERPDGRGYPDRLSASEIPEIAKIVAVAEVYDTLTAPDTYRTQKTSFEALTELRRVAGTQLDGRYVEVLATLLAGQGTEYRHLDDADFDAELDIERRMNEAAGG